MKPAKVNPFEVAIWRASAIASAGVSTPARLRPVSHSTTTESGRPEMAAAWRMAGVARAPHGERPAGDGRGLRQACDDDGIARGDGHAAFCLQRAEPRHLFLA